MACSFPVNQPEHILRTLDSQLVRATRLILYGRAALALGFPHPRPAFFATMDVDGILPDSELPEIEADEGFWDALERTNRILEPSGLYLTHLFAESQIILRSDWLLHLVPIPVANLHFLRLFRPSIEDLILTKMMRVDPEDRSDIMFLISESSLDLPSLERLWAMAKVPPIPEISEAFWSNCVWIRQELSTMQG